MAEYCKQFDNIRMSYLWMILVFTTCNSEVYNTLVVSSANRVVLPCTWLSNDSSWIFNEQTIFIGDLSIDRNHPGSMDRLENNSLEIPSVTVSYEGKYECQRFFENGTLAAVDEVVYYLNVIVDEYITELPSWTTVMSPEINLTEYVNPSRYAVPILAVILIIIGSSAAALITLKWKGYVEFDWCPIFAGPPTPPEADYNSASAGNRGDNNEMSLRVSPLSPRNSSTQEKLICHEGCHGVCTEHVVMKFELAGSGNMKYWMATAKDEPDRMILAKTVSDEARMKEFVNFRELAKGLLASMRHRNIVDVLGAFLGDVPYYIYHEYVDCGTLRDFLLRNYQESTISNKRETIVKARQDKTLQLTAITADVCAGMEYLSSQQWRHPGLATRKVLLNSKGRCKLYDIWPNDLAEDRVAQLLGQKLPPTAWLAPETLFLGRYMEHSDVWSFGVLMWEIYSLGDTPYNGLDRAEIETKLRDKRHLEQPLTCPGGLFDAMLATWNFVAEERPSFEDYRTKLTSLLNDLRSASVSEEEGEWSNVDEDPDYFCIDQDISDNDYIDGT